MILFSETETRLELKEERSFKKYGTKHPRLKTALKIYEEIQEKQKNKENLDILEDIDE